jgi:hypothetical protein
MLLIYRFFYYIAIVNLFVIGDRNIKGQGKDKFRNYFNIKKPCPPYEFKGTITSIS